MARVNVGVNPKNLTDQHLIAEAVEITMITGGLKKNNNIIKGKIPDSFCLGEGHINFFKNKIVYLKKRLDLVNQELAFRGFKASNNIDLAEFPDKYLNDWVETPIAFYLIRNRIIERLNAPLKAKSEFHRYNKIPIGKEFIAEFKLVSFTKNLYL